MGGLMSRGGLYRGQGGSPRLLMLLLLFIPLGNFFRGGLPGGASIFYGEAP